MSDETTPTSSYTVKLPDATDPHVEEHHAWGMRYPDGRVRWGQDDRVIFSWLDPDRQYGAGLVAWEDLLKKRASAANVDLTEYMHSHQLVKRRITIVVAGAEDA